MKQLYNLRVAGFIVFILFFIVLLGIMEVYAVRQLNKMESRRHLLLYETDHHKLLNAFREVSAKAADGSLKTDIYTLNDKNEKKLFPQTILDLHPLRIDIEKDYEINIIMSPHVMYGVIAFPGNYDKRKNEIFTADDAIELLNGLWYYDEDLHKHPEHKIEVEEFLQKRQEGGI